MKYKPEKIEEIKEKYKNIKPCLTEVGRRLWSALEAKSYGYGGIALVSEATKISNKTIHKGLKELEEGRNRESDRLRQKGGGRKKIVDTQGGILDALNNLVDPTSRGDPESPLRWTTRSTSRLSKELNSQGYRISSRTVYTLLKEMDYSLQSNKKSKEGSSHEDRDAQFNYINETVKEAIKKKQPSISVDTKKKENIGDYKNNGREYAKKGNPVKTNTHDFPNKKLGKVAPYGIYDIDQNNGLVNVGISHDTAEFAVHSIRTWWHKMGKISYPMATDLVITADCGGSNGNRVRLWKLELQKFATETNLNIHVRHFPPGTSKWNKIEHRMFSFISINWRGKPLLTRETVINLIAATKTEKGLMIKAFLDKNYYEKGKKINKAEVENLNIIRDEFHPEWNYTVKPKSSTF